MNDSLYTLIILSLILPLILLSLYLLKRFLLKLPRNNKQIRIASQLHIGSKEKILLIEARGKSFLIGATPETINTLHTFSETPASSEKNNLQEQHPPSLWSPNKHG